MKNPVSCLSAIALAFMLIFAACGGSEAPGLPEAPSLSPNSANAISEDDAIAAAEAIANERSLSTEDLEANAGLLFGEWQVSFDPIGTDSLSGGFLVILNAESGEVVDVVQYE